MTFEDWLRDIMHRENWTQEDFAERAGISRSTFNSYLTRNRDTDKPGVLPTMAKIKQLAHATGTSLPRLLIICGFADRSDFEDPSLSENEERLLYWYRQVPSHQRELVLTMLASAVQSATGQGEWASQGQDAGNAVG